MGDLRRGTGAIVVGGDYRGLGLVRSLGRHGIPVWLVTDPHRITAFSRYVVRRLPWPKGEEPRLHCLRSLAEADGLEGWTLFPTTDETLALIARHAGELTKRLVLTTPPWEVVQWAHDKCLTARLAIRAGVPTPRTDYPRSADELARTDYAYPVLIKPARRDSFNRLTHQKGWVVNDRRELLARYREALTLVSPDVVMVQELIPGGGEAQFSFAGVCREGEPIAYVLARRTRQFPPLIGRSSSYVESVDVPEVEKLGTALVRQMRFTGLIEIEFKHDARDGDFKILDINPRVWGWHTLGRSVGLDFAYLAWRLANGLPVAPHRAGPGLRWIRGTTDVPTALALICSGQLSPAAYWRSRRRPVERAVFAVDDPIPGLVELPLFLALAARRGAL